MSQMHEITTVIRRPNSESSQQLTKGFQQQQQQSHSTEQPTSLTRQSLPTQNSISTYTSTKNDRNNNKEKLINKNNVVKKSMPPPVPPKKHINNKSNANTDALKPNQNSSIDSDKNKKIDANRIDGGGSVVDATTAAAAVINRVCGQNLSEKQQQQPASSTKINSHKLHNNSLNSNGDKQDEDNGKTSAIVIKKGQNGASHTKYMVGNGATDCSNTVSTAASECNSNSGCNNSNVDDAGDKSDKLNDDDVASTLPTNERKNRLNSGTSSNNCHNGKFVYCLFKFLFIFSPFFVTLFVSFWVGCSTRFTFVSLHINCEQYLQIIMIWYSVCIRLRHDEIVWFPFRFS